jgi:hypothetical protein
LLGFERCRIFKRYFVAPLPVAALWKPATGAAGAVAHAAKGGAAGADRYYAWNLSLSKMFLSSPLVTSLSGWKINNSSHFLFAKGYHNKQIFLQLC